MLLSPQCKLVQKFRQVPNSLFSRHRWINECLSGVLSPLVQGSWVFSHLQTTKCCEDSALLFNKIPHAAHQFLL